MEADSESSAYPLTFPPNAETGVSACRDSDDSATVWAMLAPLLAGRPRVRESRDGGKNYRARWERNLTERLPRVPAAVPLYSSGGDSRCLVIDLDTAKGSREVVLRDAAAITTLIGRCGGAVIADESPSGGIHLYVPLQHPVPFHDARDVALALARRTPTMDPTPNTNLLAGLIRPPGSVHKSGGHQTLRTRLAVAHRIATVRNPKIVWEQLTTALSDDLAAVAANHAPTSDGPVEHVPRAGGARELTGAYLRIATTGLYDTARYESASEARQAVVTSAVWAGMTLPELASRIHTGRWPGLAAFYARYSPNSRAKALTKDWRKAVSFVTKKRTEEKPQGSTVRKSPTSEPHSHRGASGSDKKLAFEHARGSQGEYQFIRSWWTALSCVEHVRYTGRGGPAVRMVLRALGEAAMKTGSRYVAFGTRSVALATGLDHTTVACHLRRLRAELDPLVELIENERGLQGDLYELTIPDQAAKRSEALAWRRGKIHALRPAFRALGLPAAYVYEALEIATKPLSSFELAKASAMSRSTAYEALETLAAYDLVQRHAGRWSIVASTGLQALAEWLGCLADIEEQLAVHRVERAAYRAVMGAVIIWDEPPLSPFEWAAPPPKRPPGSDEINRTVIDLLQSKLGARIVNPPMSAISGGRP